MVQESIFGVAAIGEDFLLIAFTSGVDNEASLRRVVRLLDISARQSFNNCFYSLQRCPGDVAFPLQLSVGEEVLRHELLPPQAGTADLQSRQSMQDTDTGDQ